MIDDQIRDAVEATSVRLRGAPRARSWSLLATVARRHFDLVGVGWTPWSQWRKPAEEGISLLRGYADGVLDAEPASDARRLPITPIEPEDDGTDQWQSLIDLYVMLDRLADDVALEKMVRRAVEDYLENRFNALTNEYVRTTAQPIGHPEASEVVSRHAEWRTALTFIERA